jgi:hypothetical protein
MGALLDEASARSEGVTTQTDASTERHWKNWIEFMHICELPLDDPFLTRFTRHEWHLLLGAYAQKVRDQT